MYREQIMSTQPDHHGTLLRTKRGQVLHLPHPDTDAYGLCGSWGADSAPPSPAGPGDAMLPLCQHCEALAER